MINHSYCYNLDYHDPAVAWDQIHRFHWKPVAYFVWNKNAVQIKRGTFHQQPGLSPAEWQHKLG